MKKKPVIIFDIDFTVFNTTAFLKNLYKLLAQELGYSNLQEFYILAKRIYQETKNQVGYFDTRVFLSHLQKKAKTEVSFDDLEKIFFSESLYIESLYEDAREVFQELVMQRNIEAVIFSSGEKEFQMQKIEKLRDMLKEDQIHIFADKLLRLKDVLFQYKDNHIYLVDDLPTILYEAKKLNSDITTIWVNRDKNVAEYEFLYKDPDIEGFKADRTISELKEIIPLIID